MAGGRLPSKKRGSILLASGDYHRDGVYAPEALSHRPDNDYGKVIEIDVLSGTTTQIARGLRNMQASRSMTREEHGR